MYTQYRSGSLNYWDLKIAATACVEFHSLFFISVLYILNLDYKIIDPFNIIWVFTCKCQYVIIY